MLLEGLLSADNALVLAILVLGLPRQEQRQALRYGIIGAFAFRILATLLAVQLIAFGWVKLVGAAYLLYLSFKHFFGGRRRDTSGATFRSPRSRRSGCRRSGRRSSRSS